MMLEKRKVKFQVDCGATINVIPQKYVRNTYLQPSTTKLKMWIGTELTSIGKFRIVLRNLQNMKKYSLGFTVIKPSLTPLLGKCASEQMNLITVNYNNNANVSSVPECKQLLMDYADFFNSELGSLPGQVHLQVTETVTPHRAAAGRMLVSIIPQVQKELKRLEELRVIALVDVPTDWNSRMITATKSTGEIRICIDPRHLNKALKLERYQLPTTDEVLPRLTNAEYFTKLDVTSAYSHVILDNESSYLTTFQTGFRRYRWLRLPFGTCVSSEIFQKRLHLPLDGLNGVACVADGIIVFGSGDELDQASADHDLNLKLLTTKIPREENQTEQRKSPAQGISNQLHWESRKYRNGLLPNPAKIDVITKFQPPTSVEGVQGLCGTVNYLARFLLQLSSVMESIRRLMRNDVPWTWSRVHDAAFAEMKQLVTKAPVLSFYDPNAPFLIQCDANSEELGAARKACRI
ncbi:unnamed protein product [Acanthosepion pharaonis]|uniref:Reverse transcriptase domain-containing protein n=1 Tax=Acanthosepion pharaonis TaxID=158019 RepID=A0A812CIB2_ACAPH|nr:unnamed protein product [Sepia pharaonis]